MIKFIIPSKGFKKYVAILSNGKRVPFGDRRYQHYHDKIGKWSSLDHNDKKRRWRYRRRHGALKCKDGRSCVDVKYSPAWFAWHYLW